MNRLAQIQARKHALLDRSERGRDEIARIFYNWRARTALATEVAGILRNPVVLAGLGLLALKMPWRRAYRVGGWIWRGWTLLRTVRRMFV